MTAAEARAALAANATLTCSWGLEGYWLASYVAPIGEWWLTFQAPEPLHSSTTTHATSDELALEVELLGGWAEWTALERLPLS